MKTELKAVRCVPPKVPDACCVHCQQCRELCCLPCAPLSRAMCDQLVVETAEERFDERRVLLLKGQIIQLERQVSAGGCSMGAEGRQTRQRGIPRTMSNP